MKTILVPTDFSDYANNALNFAYNIALKTDTQIQLIHVIEAFDTQSYSTTGTMDLDPKVDLYMNEVMKVTTKRMDNIVNDPSYTDVTIISHVHYGKPYESISEAIVQHDTDLVVMGTLGSSGLDELFIGSNTEKVVRYAKFPIISVPEKAAFTSIKNIVFATNLTVEDDAVIQKLKITQSIFEARLHILWVNTLHILKNEEEMKQKLEEFAQRHMLLNYSVNVSKAIFVDAGIMNYADEINADMIAITTGGKKGIAYLFSGSLAEDVVNHSCLPVWTYNVGRQQ